MMSSGNEALHLSSGDALLLSDFPNFAEFDLSKDTLMLQSNGIDGGVLGNLNSNDLDYILENRGGGQSQDDKGSSSENSDSNSVNGPTNGLLLHMGCYMGYSDGSETSDESLFSEWMHSEKLVENAMKEESFQSVQVMDNHKDGLHSESKRVSSDCTAAVDGVMLFDSSSISDTKDMLNSMTLEELESFSSLGQFEQDSTMTSSVSLEENSMAPILSLPKDEMVICPSAGEELMLAANLSIASSLEHVAFSQSLRNNPTQSNSVEVALQFSQVLPVGQSPSISLNNIVDVGPAPDVVLNNTTLLNPRVRIGIPSVFQIGSPLPSPTSTRSTPDGSSLPTKLPGREEKVNGNNLVSLTLPQPVVVDANSVKDCCSLASIISPRVNVCQSNLSYPSIQRSQSSHALGFPNFQTATSPVCAQRSPMPAVRRVFSTGDLQICYMNRNLPTVERSISEEILSPKFGYYTSEERKVKLHRYRQKRNERNFSKKIKYACRKTLADSRPRVRGRFARTLDDSGELLIKENGSSHDDDFDDVQGCGIAVSNGFFNPKAKYNWLSARMSSTRRHKL